MDKRFISNVEDKEALYKSGRDKELLRDEPPETSAASDVPKDCP